MQKLLFIIVCSVLFSCGKKQSQIPETDMGFNYFPTQSGKFVVYDIDSTVYAEISRDTVTYRFRVKEKIADSFTDNEGKNAIRLERYIKRFDENKPYDSMTWTMKEVYAIYPSEKNIQVQENNVRFVKLIFPVALNASWNGNAANTLQKEMYVYDYINIKEGVFSNVLKVSQKEFRTLISYESKFEKYAKGIGLIQKQHSFLLSNNIIPNVSVENRIESGYIYTQTLVSYGYE
ncbi:MAG: hypothetical protein KF900_08165 [Bacteroidetes bacterium]|nr:hypothetical protein [Bacteroidota bacterium]